RISRRSRAGSGGPVPGPRQRRRIPPRTPRRAEGVRILVVNAGSSSLKLAVREGDDEVASTTVERWEGDGHDAPIRDFVEQNPTPDMVGHRVVHGGPRFTEPVLV